MLQWKMFYVIQMNVIIGKNNTTHNSHMVSASHDSGKSTQNIAKFKQISKVYILNESKNFVQKSYWIWSPDWRLFILNFELGFGDLPFELEPSFLAKKCGTSWDLSIPQVSAANWILVKMLPGYLILALIIISHIVYHW